MALEDQLKNKEDEQERQDGPESLTDEEEQDLDIMVNLAKIMIDEGGYQVIEQAEGSSDPGQVIGQFLVQLGSQIAESLPEEAKPSPRIMLAEGGWVEQISDYLQEEYDVERDVMDRAEMYIGGAAQSIAQGQQAGQQPPGQPAPPQGGPMNG